MRKQLPSSTNHGSPSKETLDGLLIGKVQVDNRRSTNFLRAVFRHDTKQDRDCTDLHSERAREPADQSITIGMMHVIWAVGQDLYNPPSAKDPPIDPMGTKMAAKPSNPDLIPCTTYTMATSMTLSMGLISVIFAACLFVYHAEARKFNRVEVEDWEKLPEDMQTDSSDVGSSLEARQGQCHRSCSKRCVAQEGQLTRCRTTCTKRCLVGDEDTDEDVANTTTRSSAFRSTTVPSVPDHTTTATFNTTTTVDTAIEATTIPSTLGSVVPTKTRRNRITNRNKKLSPDGEVVWLAIFQETG